MPQIAIPVVISAIGTSGSVAAAGGIAAFGGWAAVGAALAVNVAIGAAMGAIAMISESRAKGRNPADKDAGAEIDSKAQRNVPIPVIFGRGRSAANYVNLGNFFSIEPWKGKGVSPNLIVMNAVMAIAEGQIRSSGNWRVNGSTKDDVESQLQIDDDPGDVSSRRTRYLYIAQRPGHDDAGMSQVEDFYNYVDTSGDDPQPAFTIPDRNKLPYRNTALALVRHVCGQGNPGLLDITGDHLGPDFTYRKSYTFTETGDGGNQPRDGHYDAFTESWYSTMEARDDAGPFGVYKYSRRGGVEQVTAPPTGVTSDIHKAWYLGRHDILVVHDPDDESQFYVGRWGIDPSDDAWKQYRPHPTYAWTMLAHHLDEQHGILHSLHNDDDAGIIYIMRWWLLTGRVERLETDLTHTDDFRRLAFSTEHNAYIVSTVDHLFLVSPDTGKRSSSTAVDNASETPIGVFGSGRFIGVIFPSRVRLWDYIERTFTTYNSEGASIVSVQDSGESYETPLPYFGSAQWATQNTWTGQVALGCQHSGDYGFVTFIPSTEEPDQENTACGSPDEQDFTPYTQLLGRKWVRDWSYRIPGETKLRLLEGESSIAASLYSVIFQVQILDSGRWGGGLPETLGCLQSFEALHARCVAPERYLRSNAFRWESGGAMRHAYEFSIAKCGDMPAHTERFEPDDTQQYTWRSSAGGILWMNTLDNPNYDDTLAKHSGDYDGMWILRTSQMGTDRYMVGNKTNSKSPPLTGKAWKPGYHSKGCPQGVWINGVYGIINSAAIKVESVSVQVRADDNTQSPEQKAEYVYMERYKADYVLDAQTSLSAFVDDILLAACNGYRTIIDGQLHVGILAPGRLPMMQLTDDLRVGQGQLTLAAGQQPNTLLLQYANRFDEYRADFQSAYDDFEIDAIGQAITQTPSNPGITRPAQAQKIVSLMRDLVASHTRQYSATYKYTGYVLSAGDSVAIWDRENGLAGDLFVVNNWEETEDGAVKLTATDHVALVSGIRQSDASDPPAPGTGGNPPLEPGRCERVRVSTGTDTVYFNNGAMYPAGAFTVRYIRDAVMKTAEGGYLVQGYKLVLDSGGTQTDIVTAPAVTDPTDGYGSVEEATAANTGSTADFTTTDPGAIGIVTTDSTRFDNPDGNTIYELCYNQSTGGPGFPDPTGGGGSTSTYAKSCTALRTKLGDSITVTMTSQGSTTYVGESTPVGDRSTYGWAWWNNGETFTMNYDASTGTWIYEEGDTGESETPVKKCRHLRLTCYEETYGDKSVIEVLLELGAGIGGCEDTLEFYFSGDQGAETGPNSRKIITEWDTASGVTSYHSTVSGSYTLMGSPVGAIGGGGNHFVDVTVTTAE